MTPQRLSAYHPFILRRLSISVDGVLIEPCQIIIADIGAVDTLLLINSNSTKGRRVFWTLLHLYEN